MHVCAHTIDYIHSFKNASPITTPLVCFVKTCIQEINAQAYIRGDMVVMILSRHMEHVTSCNYENLFWSYTIYIILRRSFKLHLGVLTLNSTVSLY